MGFRKTFQIVVAISGVLCLAKAATVELVLGVPIERELAGGETHVYSVTLAAGQYLHAVAEQRGIDLKVAVFTPDGKELISLDSLTAMIGPEPVSVVAETAGVYRLEVSPINKEAPKGRYEVQIDELGMATPEDNTRIDAQKLFAEGDKLAALGTAESYVKSLDKLEQALSLWQALGDRWHAAVTLSLIGEVDYATGKPLALNRSNEVLNLWRNLGDIRGEAQALNNLGSVHLWLGDIHRGLEYLGQALELRQTIGDRDGEVQTLNNMGSAYTALGQQTEALQYLGRTLAVARVLGNRSWEAHALYNIAIAYKLLGETEKALDQLRQALELFRTMGYRRGIAASLTNIGAIYVQLGDFQRAMDQHTEALIISREAGAPNVEAAALRNIGGTYRMMGDPRKALEYFAQALPIGQASRQPELEASLQAGMGAAYADLGDKPKALSYYSRALQLDRVVGRTDYEVTILTEIGLLSADMGDTEKAIASLDNAVTLSQSIQYKHGEARALSGLARAERDGGRLHDARIHLESAMPIIEALRTDIASDELRTSYLALNRDRYELYIDVLMREQQAAAAFEASERSRARSLLETLAEAHAHIRQGADAELVERERTLEQQLNAADRRRMQLLGQKDRAEQVATVEKELKGLLSDYQDVRARIRTTNPHYAALTQPQPLKLQDVQQQVLDNDSLLLEYALGDDHSYLWAVTASSIESFTLPKRAEIEAAAKRTYELLTTGHKREFQRQTELALSGVSQMLLGPVSRQLAKKRLVIVSDGALQYIPFGALPEPGVATSQPLVVEHEIVNLPSASVLAILRRETAGRKPATQAVAMLSDPVFEADDPRVRRDINLAQVTAKPANDSAGLAQRELTRSATDSGLGRFERLRFSRKEADSIEALASAGQVMKAVDFRASKATATSTEFGQYRIVHFATHGLINSQHPELSGIVLSLVDEQGRSQDGFLRAHEIYNLKLGADLVVLSACQTALGKEVKGEGLMSLTRGFMYAGAPRVVASLWDVKDEAAAELMKPFYHRMLKANLHPAAALRVAQISMWKEQRWVSPYDWAAFVIQGEWR
jgi:CHAT domain-containing protein